MRFFCNITAVLCAHFIFIYLVLAYVTRLYWMEDVADDSHVDVGLLGRSRGLGQPETVVKLDFQGHRGRKDRQRRV